MMRRSLDWKHVANGAALAGVLVVAGVVAHTTPDETQQQGPILVRGAIGETLTGRNIRATVDDVRIADSVTASNGWQGTTTGVWVVAEASAEAVVDDFGAFLGTAVPMKLANRARVASGITRKPSSAFCEPRVEASSITR